MSETNFSNNQSQDVKYLRTTDVDCRVCNKSKLNVRQVVKKQGAITEHLECPICGEGFPRVVTLDGQVIHDPFSDSVKNIR